MSSRNLRGTAAAAGPTASADRAGSAGRSVAGSGERSVRKSASTRTSSRRRARALGALSNVATVVSARSAASTRGRFVSASDRRAGGSVGSAERSPYGPIRRPSTPRSSPNSSRSAGRCANFTIGDPSGTPITSLRSSMAAACATRRIYVRSASRAIGASPQSCGGGSRSRGEHDRPRPAPDPRARRRAAGAAHARGRTQKDERPAPLAAGSGARLLAS